MILSFAELLPILGITGFMAYECYIALRSRSWVQIYRPTLFVAVVLAFYVLVGPLRAILSTGEVANFVGTTGTLYRGLEHRHFLFWGWLGAFTFYGCTLIGFHAFKPKLLPNRLMVRSNLNSVSNFGFILCCIGLVLYIAVNGSSVFNLLNPLAPQNFDKYLFDRWQGLDLGPFHNYFKYSINLLIPGIILQFAVWLRSRKGFLTVASWIGVASLIYLSESFRYRILLLFVPLIFLWLFYHKRRPKLIFLLIFMITFVAFNGIIGLSRTHIRGLNFDKISEYGPLEVFNSSFEEAGVFFTTSAVFNYVPRNYKFVGLQPFINASLQPIPRNLLPSKPDGSYANNLRTFIYETDKSFTAYLGFAEYYIMYGWSSLIAISLFFGALLKRLWTWFLWRQYDPLAQCVYLLNASFLYVVISRGYLAQVFMLYVITVAPLALVYYCLSEEV